MKVLLEQSRSSDKVSDRDGLENQVVRWGGSVDDTLDSSFGFELLVEVSQVLEVLDEEMEDLVDSIALGSRGIDDNDFDIT